MNIFKKILLYLSAFIPLYVLLLIKISIELINQNLTFNILNTTLICLLCLLSGFGLLGIFLSFNQDKKVQITVLGYKNLTEKHFLGYFSLFVLFALTFQIELVCMTVVFFLILVMIGIVYIKNNLFYINPFLNIIGFSFYNIEYQTNSSKKTGIFLFYGKIETNKKYYASITTYNFNSIKK